MELAIYLVLSLLDAGSDGRNMHTSVIRELSIVVALILCLTGCGLTHAQKEATAKFADAATKFGEASSDELVKMRDQTVAMNTALYRVPDLQKKDLAEGQEPIAIAYINKKEYEKLAGDFSGDWYNTFISGPQAMKAYGATLTDILNADNKEQVKKSSDALASALKAIPGSPAGNASSAAISALAQQLTEMYLDSMKAHAIKSIVASTKDAVPTICDTVGRNFQTSGEGFAFRFKDTAMVLSTSSETGMAEHKEDRLSRSDSLSGYLLAKENLDEVNRAFPKVQESSAACTAANAALLNALQNATYDMKDIENFFDEARTAATNIKSLNSGK